MCLVAPLLPFFLFRLHGPTYLIPAPGPAYRFPSALLVGESSGPVHPSQKKKLVSRGAEQSLQSLFSSEEGNPQVHVLYMEQLDNGLVWSRTRHVLSHGWLFSAARWRSAEQRSRTKSCVSRTRTMEANVMMYRTSNQYLSMGGSILRHRVTLVDILVWAHLLVPSL